MSTPQGKWFLLIGFFLIVPAVSFDDPSSLPLILRLEVPAEVRPGKTVPLMLRVRNDGDLSVSFLLSGYPAHDFVIVQADGREVWRWLHGQTVRPILVQKLLHPGEGWEIVAEWDQRDNLGIAVPPGVYRVRGVLNTGPPGKLETEMEQLVVLPPGPTVDPIVMGGAGPPPGGNK